MTLLELPAQRWECPNCDLQEIESPKRVAPGESTTRMHHCAGLNGLWGPMVPAGIRAKVEARQREDYANGDLLQADQDGRPYMSVVTTRDDGEDCTVLAPCVVRSREECRG